MSNQKLAVFDMDGTLLDTIDDLADACNTALRQCGFPQHDREAYKYFVGNGTHNLVIRALAPVCDTVSIQRVEAVFHAYYSRHSQDRTRPYDGIPALLAALKRAGYRLAVLSNKPHEYVGRLAEQYFPGIFDAAYGQREGVPIKPDPTAVGEIREQLGFAAADCVYIGDTSVDVETGKNAGMETVGVLWGFRTKEELEQAGADVIVHKCDELEKFLIDKTGSSGVY